MTDVFHLIDATWPAASVQTVGGWTIREGRGGGSRVSAATWDGGGAPDIPAMEAACAALGQSPIVMIRPGEDELDTELEARGYDLRDPVVLMSAPVETLADTPPSASSYATWPPLAIQNEIWAAGGIGPERLAIMDRAKGRKTSLFGRAQDRPAGSAFVACHGKTAMLHALEVLPDFRRHGVGRMMMRHAALWAQDAGVTSLLILVTRENSPANALYTSLNFQPVGHYHYRRK